MALVFESKDYRVFLSQWIDGQPNRGRGIRSQLATFLGCRPAFISQVMSGQMELSAEQAQRAARFMGLSDSEAQYFRKLVDLSRASTHELREILQVELIELKRRLRATNELLKMNQSLDPTAEIEYYSSWQIAAAHLALTIPRFQSREQLAKYLRLPMERISEIITILQRCGLVSESKGKLKVINQLVHGDPKSAGARRHLVNLRQKAMDVAQFVEPQNFQYSAMVSVSNEDIEKVRDILAQALQRSAQVIKSSSEEKIAIINIDWISAM